MKRFWLFASFMVVLAAMPALAQQEGAAERPIIVGGDRDYPPYEFLDKDGKPAGYNVDLTRAIAEVMGMKVEFRFGGWSEMRSALHGGARRHPAGDFLLRGTGQDHRLLPAAHHRAPRHLRPRGTPAVITLEELRGKEVIVFRDGIMHEILREHRLRRDLWTTDTPADALRLAGLGQARLRGGGDVSPACT